jgi:hypothetical protein
MPTKQLTFADIAVGQWFYMDFGGQSDVWFEKTGPDTCSTKKLNSPGYLEVKAKPLWEVKNLTQIQEEAERRLARAHRPAVNGHSSTYPYGEH